MTTSRDLSHLDDVRTLVDSFYEKIGRDELLAPVFNDFAHVDWATHLPAMYRFWESMLFGAGTYQGSPFSMHAVLPVQKEHFVRWLALFTETVNAHLVGPKAFALTRGVGSNFSNPTLPVLSVSGTNSDSTTAGLWGGAWTAGALVSSGNVEAAASGTVHWKGRAALQSPADGVLSLTNSATNVSGTLRLATVQLDGTGGVPAQPVSGQIYFNSADKHFYGYDGTLWKQLDN